MIEHGDGGTPEIYKLMQEKGIDLCPTLAAGDSIAIYKGWNPYTDPEPVRIKNKKAGFSQALKAGVTISAGGDVGVFSHGNNVLELEMMVKYGMQPLAVLQSATATNARLFHLNRLGQIKPGFTADITVVRGNPAKDISALREVVLVLKDGKPVVDNR